MVDQQLTIHFDKLKDIGQRGVRRAAAFVAMGQKAWGDESIKSVTIELPFSFQLLPDPLPKELADEVRSSFRLWLVGNALSEIVQGLSLFADEYFRNATLLSFHQKPVSQAALDRIEKFRKDTSMFAKLKNINDECGLKSGLLEHADGWVRARNAIAHNHGIINERTCPDGSNELVVSWREFEFSIDGKKIDNIIGHHVEKGGLLSFTWGNGTKKFALGAPVDFSEQEILNICMTAFLQVETMTSDLHKRLEKTVGKANAP